MTIAEATVKRLLRIVAVSGTYTIDKISNISGITQSTVSDIVNGTTTNTGIVTIKKLCDGFRYQRARIFRQSAV